MNPNSAPEQHLGCHRILNPEAKCTCQYFRLRFNLFRAQSKTRYIWWWYGELILKGVWVTAVIAAVTYFTLTVIKSH